MLKQKQKLEERVFYLIRQRQRTRKMLRKQKIINDSQETVLDCEECVLKRLRDYFRELMNVENHR